MAALGLILDVLHTGFGASRLVSNALKLLMRCHAHLLSARPSNMDQLADEKDGGAARHNDVSVGIV